MQRKYIIPNNVQTPITPQNVSNGTLINIPFQTSRITTMRQITSKKAYMFQFITTNCIS